MGLKENIQRMEELSRQAELGGGEERLKRQREAGRMTARERVEALLDRGSFVELDKFKTHRATDFGMGERKIAGDGVVTGGRHRSSRLNSPTPCAHTSGE